MSRIVRDNDRRENYRRQQASDSGESMKKRNEKRKEKEVPNVTGTLRFYAKSDDDKNALFKTVFHQTNNGRQNCQHQQPQTFG